MTQEYMPSLSQRKNPMKDQRCRHGHNPGVWPYVARCVMFAGHVVDKHKDRNDREWSDGDPGSWVTDEHGEVIEGG